MSYEELKSYFYLFRCGVLSRMELIAAIALWQARLGAR